MYAAKDFPINDIPIYDFSVTDDGQIVCREHHKYVRTEGQPGHPLPGRIKYSYRIHTGAGITTKTNLQMDRYLNGHLFTLNPDKFQARNIILSHYEQKAEAAQAMADQCNEILLKLRTPATPLFERKDSEDDI